MEDSWTPDSTLLSQSKNSQSSSQSRGSQFDLYGPVSHNLTPEQIFGEGAGGAITERNSYKWVLIEEAVEKEIFKEHRVRFRWLYGVKDGNVLKCIHHEDCDFKVQLIKTC
jgi:hypothetical protein